METEDALLSQLGEYGYRARMVTIQHLSELHEEIENRYVENSFDAEFYRERLSGFVFKPPDGFEQAKSLVVAAAPQPQFQVVFTGTGSLIPSSFLLPTRTTQTRKWRRFLRSA